MRGSERVIKKEFHKKKGVRGVTPRIRRGVATPFI